MTLAEQIKEKALDLGYADVGITTAEPFWEYNKIINEREFYDFLRTDSRNIVGGSLANQVVPQARSIISLVYSFSHVDFPEKLKSHVGRVYQARCYNPPENRINGMRFKMFKDFLEEKNLSILNGAFLPDRAVAARAGTITYGKNNCAYSKKYGSFIILSSIMVDKELEYDDEPTVKNPCPPNCTICMDACPSGALYKAGMLNPLKCISYNNWFTQTSKSGCTHIPTEMREKIGLRIHGCDICQEVCPRNKRPLENGKMKDAFLETLAEKFDLNKVLFLDDEYYKEVIEPIMYNYIQGYEYFQRNAAIAMGNSKNTEYIPSLEKSLAESVSLVREYSAWALGKIGGNEAKTILLNASKTETNEAVKKEIVLALTSP